MKFLAKTKAFVSDEAGVTAIEYALILALVAVAIVGSIEILGDSLSIAFFSVSSDLQSATSSI